MKKALWLVLVFVFLGVLSYGFASHHLVKTDKGVAVLTKRFLTCADTFVDVRTWSSADFDAHPELKRAMINQGYRDMLVELKTGELQASLNDVANKAAAMAEEIATQIVAAVEGWLGGMTDSNGTPANPSK
jgi:hypothetical protein